MNVLKLTQLQSGVRASCAMFPTDVYYRYQDKVPLGTHCIH